MPIMLGEPDWSAACEPQYPRCSLPGESDSPQVWVMMSKSQLRSRFSYCASSTVRTVTPMPRRSSEGLIEQEDALEARILGEEFDRQRLAGLGVDELLVAHLVAGFLEQPHRLAQIGAHRLGIAVDRIGVGRREYLGRHLVAHRLQDFELAAGRQPGGGKLGALEIAGDALVLAEEDLLVHLLEVEREIESAAHPRILELCRGGC